MNNSKKIKVLMIGNAPSVKGGITSVISQLLNHDWNAENVEMQFIPTYAEGNNIKKIVYFLIAYGKIIQRFRTNKPDIVHIHMSYKGSFKRKYLIHKLCKKHGVKDVIHLHGSEFEKWYNNSKESQQEKIRTLLRESSSFIVLGEKWNSVIKGIEPKTNTIVVSNTIAIPKETVRWNEDKFQVLFLGVLIERKGVKDLLKAINKLVKEKKIGKMKFVIAGTGKEEQILHEMCKEQGLNDYVTFAGWTVGEKKKDLLLDSQLLVLPSYNEGLPIAILEAISYGLPVVSTDVGDISSAVVDGYNGYLIKPGEVDKLAEKMCLVSQDKDAYIRMSESSRKLAEKEFADVHYFQTIKNCYK